MKNFKNSGIEWLGEIPEHWEIVRLANFGIFLKGNGISRQDLIEDGESAIHYGDIYTKYEISTTALKSKISTETAQNITSIHNGDILFAGSGETKEDIGKNIVYLGKEKAFAGGDVIIFRQKKNNALFLSYALNTKYVKSLKGIDSKGEIIVHIYASNLKDIKIPIPPLKEQEQIANFLDEKCEKIANFIEKKEKLLSLLQEQKQALINETITKGLDKNVKLKNSSIEWLGEIPEHWEVRKLKMLFSFGNGLNITKADFISFGIPCISYGEIHSKYPCRLDLSVHKLPFVSETYLNDKPQSLLSKGDFVFADTSEDIEGSGNFTCIQSNISLFAGYHTIILRPKTQIHSLYFSFLFDSIFVRNQIREKVWGVKVFSITKSILKEVQCFIPPLKEQEQIANFLDEKCEKIDSLITKIKKQIELIKEYKTTLINEAVCGRMDLNKG
ncbi:restriction endonuclease subunit S [Campylobacter sp. LH-2024]|uniref:restriction endonuclease subunit S n=1 Tax=Campylobacter sp. LH-2024 TaxID=3239825 RepID=UPI003B7C5331